MNFIRDKKAFTLIELVIVVLIMLIAYSLIFSNKNFSLEDNKELLALSKLREFLMNNFSFKEEIVFSCIEDNFSCFVRVDKELKEDFKVDNFFTIKPKVYEYSKDKKELEFKDLRVDNFDYKVIFELKIDNDYKIDEFILDTLNGEVYLFNSIFTKPDIYKSLDDIIDIIEKNQKEVRDAF